MTTTTPTTTPTPTEERLAHAVRALQVAIAELDSLRGQVLAALAQAQPAAAYVPDAPAAPEPIVPMRDRDGDVWDPPAQWGGLWTMRDDGPPPLCRPWPHVVAHWGPLTPAAEPEEEPYQPDEDPSPWRPRVEELRGEVERARELAADGDFDRAHGVEDDLRDQALRWISEAPDLATVQELADVALSTEGVEFGRRCAW